VFSIRKLRTMRPGPSSGEWTQDRDERITRFGGFLRRSHIDELPQILNILTGDLSMVGPRPEQPQYVQKLSESIPFYRTRHVVRPGITGWAQVNYPYGSNEEDAYEKLQLELWYLNHQSFALDLRILARTVRQVLGSRGR
jgi:lipopolysaccharide/colanic/teichoic acid biosynthesis glycosyltransferase